MKIFRTIRSYTEYIANLIRKDWLAHAFLHFGLVTGLTVLTPLTAHQAFVCSGVFGVLYEFIWDYWLCEDYADLSDVIANLIGGGLAWLIFVI